MDLNHYYQSDWIYLLDRMTIFMLISSPIFDVKYRLEYETNFICLCLEIKAFLFRGKLFVSNVGPTAIARPYNFQYIESDILLVSRVRGHNHCHNVLASNAERIITDILDGYQPVSPLDDPHGSMNVFLQLQLFQVEGLVRSRELHNYSSSF